MLNLTPVNFGDKRKTWDEWNTIDTANEELMDAQDNKAREEGKLLGRVLREPAGDGYAYYEIIKVNKKTVGYRHLEIGDNYYANHWGDVGNLDKAWVEDLLEAEDSLSALMS